MQAALLPALFQVRGLGRRAGVLDACFDRVDVALDARRALLNAHGGAALPTDAHRVAAAYARDGGAAGGRGNKDRNPLLRQNFEDRRSQDAFVGESRVDNSNRPFVLPPPVSCSGTTRRLHSAGYILHTIQ